MQKHKVVTQHSVMANGRQVDTDRWYARCREQNLSMCNHGYLENKILKYNVNGQKNHEILSINLVNHALELSTKTYKILLREMK